jgi:hypothetical protein
LVIVGVAGSLDVGSLDLGSLDLGSLDVGSLDVGGEASAIAALSFCATAGAADGVGISVGRSDGVAGAELGGCRSHPRFIDTSAKVPRQIRNDPDFCMLSPFIVRPNATAHRAAANDVE